MKQNYTHILFILDKSGSMEIIRQSTIDGFNKFLKEQQELNTEITFSLIQFDDQYEEWTNFEPISKVNELNLESYKPRGSTALLDAIGKSVIDTGNILSMKSENSRPDKVIVVILTDGYENASTKFTKLQIADIIKEQENKYNWKFVYLGANQDAIMTASTMNMAATSSVTFVANPASLNAVYTATSKNISNYITNNTNDISYTNEQRREILNG